MLQNKWLAPLINFHRLAQGMRGYARYWRDWRAYQALPGAETLSRDDAFPQLFDRTATTPFDRHYFYQDIWAFKAVAGSGVQLHVDVGSHVVFIGLLSAVMPVVFVDIRPLKTDLENVFAQAGSVLQLPFANDSVFSLSSLHVAEHIGLGRYGDALDPLGTQKAARELVRVLAPGGSLYFSLPVGEPRVCFNAHRIHAPEQILEYFCELQLAEFSAVLDDGQFAQHINPLDAAGARYACGLFHFAKHTG